MPISEERKKFLEEYHLRTKRIEFTEANLQKGMTPEEAKWAAEMQVAEWSQPIDPDMLGKKEH